jgi:xanthine dehydrogenase YagS FAD-binding subunit
MDGGRIAEARLALGGVAHKPWRVAEAEAMLRGQPPAEDAFRRAGAAVLGGAAGFGHNTFKIELAGRVIVRALKQATAMGRAGS